MRMNLGRVGIWTVGDNSAGSQTTLSSGTNDFSGGTVDALVDLLLLGRGRVGFEVVELFAHRLAGQ